MSSTCTVETCERNALAKGFCPTHYARNRTYGSPLPNKPIRGRGGSCEVDGCDRKKEGRGLCSKHYQRLMKLGDPLATLRVERETCGVRKCNRKHYANGACKKHWEVMPDNATMTQEGYVLLYRPEHPFSYRQGSIHEHRLVMAEELGRPLLKGESVHHKNGVRHDNRRENLELRVGYHPKGSSIKEQVEWAIEILRRYAPDHIGAPV